eukprot:CAMPEP_0167750982 /NCGR_PEP_ID=MMETSP0110_2-20121227/6301_1 /TAXON_ID=629695 /ORGANISM="Gymnochlora sp., Strain CCMP2014" /LENGTH=871 /DNA_ID=CAMNT_0007636379 /DNA_START=152 /DNA_END=2767 /DNA_ORIENTATION=+
MDLFEERAHQNTRMTYRAVGSSTGQFEFSGVLNGNVSQSAFGAGDIPMTQANYDRVTIGGGRTMLHVPFAVGAIAIFHSVPESELGGKPLDLTGCLLARIFLRNITTWDHPDILAANPDLTVPPNRNIMVGHRTLGSSSTSGTTEYLKQNCPQYFTVEPGSTIDWPADTTAVQGSGGMASFLGTTDYAIGYLDAGQGNEIGLSEIALQNKDGVYLSTKEADIGAAATAAIAANVLPATGDLSFANVNLYDQSGADTWPITLMSYFYIDQDQRAYGQAGYLTKAFVDYILSDEGQSLAQDFGFVPVPAAVKTYNDASLGTILYNTSATEYTFESSTQKGIGAGEFVISSKRRAFGDVERDLLNDEITKLSERIAVIEAGASTVTLHGSGTTNPSKLIWKTMSLFETQALLPLHLSYRAVGSSTGQREFIGADNGNMSYTDFGCGDIPMKAADYQYYATTGREVVHIPFVMGAIAVFHSVPLGELEGSPLDLDSCLLARIFSRDITTWDHPDIIARNPNLNVPANQPITVVHRVKGSSSTSGFTQYLTTACPAQWTLGTGSTITWPADTVGAQGSGGVSDYIQANPYSISYIDSGHGHNLNLGEVSLQNADGNFLDSKSANISRAGAEALKLNILPTDAGSDWSAVNLYNLPGADTWPIVLFSYFYVERDIKRLGQTGEILKALIKYLLDNADLLAEFRFSPVPSAVYDYNINTLNSIVVASNATEMIFESAASTQSGVGAGRYTISGKRRDFGEVTTTEQEATLTSTDSDITALTARIITLEIQQNELNSCSCDKYDDTRVSNTANAALGLAVISLVLLLIMALVMCCYMCGGSSSKSHDKASVGMDSKIEGSKAESVASQSIPGGSKQELV